MPHRLIAEPIRTRRIVDGVMSDRDMTVCLVEDEAGRRGSRTRGTRAGRL